MGRASHVVSLALAALVAGPAVAQETCGGIVQAECLAKLGAGFEAAGGAIDAAAVEADPRCGQQWTAYRVCLAALSAPKPSPPVSSEADCTDAQSARLWSSAEKAGDCLGYQGYRDACPNTPEAKMAAAALSRLGCTPAASPAAARPDPETTTVTSAENADLAAARARAAETSASADLARAHQVELKRLGLYRGALDGVWGDASRRAFERFRVEAGLTAVSDPSETSLRTLRAAPTVLRAAPEPELETPTPDPGPAADGVAEPPASGGAGGGDHEYADGRWSQRGPAPFAGAYGAVELARKYCSDSWGDCGYGDFRDVAPADHDHRAIGVRLCGDDGRWYQLTHDGPDRFVYRSFADLDASKGAAVVASSRSFASQLAGVRRVAVGDALLMRLRGVASRSLFGEDIACAD